MQMLLLAVLLTASVATAEPLLQVQSGNIRIVLHSEPCELRAIANLPHRAEWIVRNETFAGCWTLDVFDQIVMYFEDRTAVTVPAKLFVAVRGI